MPSRAYASFLQRGLKELYRRTSKCQCPHGLMPHFYCNAHHFAHMIAECVNALTGLCLISTWVKQTLLFSLNLVSMPSRAYASFLLMRLLGYQKVSHRVNALTGLCLISTVSNEVYVAIVEAKECQCPHGLMPHFYDRCVDVYVNFGYGGVNALTGLCLISTWTKVSRRTMCVLVSMPSRAYASFLRQVRR